MAEDVEIEPEFEDEDDFTTRLDELSKRNKQSTPDTTAPPIEGAPPVEPEAANIPTGTRPFKPGRKNKENQKLLEQAQREAERKRRQDQTEARRLLREQQQDQAREQRLQAKEALRISREQVTAARSDAISERIQTYSFASSIGFPGYIAASVVDALHTRPKEEKAVQEEKQYQKELQEYNEKLRQYQIDQKRRQEQEIRDMPIDAVEVDDKGRPVKNPPLPPNLPQPPSNVPPSNNPPQGPQGSGNQPPGNQPPAGPGQGGLQPPQKPQRQPPVIPQGNIGQAAVPLTAAIQTAQYINQAIDKLADSINTTAVSIAKGDGSEASKGITKTFKSTIDPLGVQIPLNVAVQGFETLIDVNKAILDSTKQNLAFAPQSLQADISGELQKLIQTIELTRKVDPTTAELIKANAQFDMAWAEARAQLIENLGPAIVKLLELITTLLRAQTTVVEFGSGFVQGFAGSFAPVLTAILSQIASNTSKDIDALDDSDILNQIGSFFNAGDQRNKMRANNTFPNI